MPLAVFGVSSAIDAWKLSWPSEANAAAGCRNGGGGGCGGGATSGVCGGGGGDDDKGGSCAREGASVASVEVIEQNIVADAGIVVEHNLAMNVRLASRRAPSSPESS